MSEPQQGPPAENATQQSETPYDAQNSLSTMEATEPANSLTATLEPVMSAAESRIATARARRRSTLTPQRIIKRTEVTDENVSLTAEYFVMMNEGAFFEPQPPKPPPVPEQEDEFLIGSMEPNENVSFMSGLQKSQSSDAVDDKSLSRRNSSSQNINLTRKTSSGNLNIIGSGSSASVIGSIADDLGDEEKQKRQPKTTSQRKPAKDTLKQQDSASKRRQSTLLGSKVENEIADAFLIGSQDKSQQPPSSTSSKQRRTSMSLKSRRGSVEKLGPSRNGSRRNSIEKEEARPEPEPEQPATTEPVPEPEAELDPEAAPVPIPVDPNKPEREYVYKHHKEPETPRISRPPREILSYVSLMINPKFDIPIQQLLNPDPPKPPVELFQEDPMPKKQEPIVVERDDRSLLAEKSVAMAVSGTRDPSDPIVGSINSEFIKEAFENIEQLVAEPAKPEPVIQIEPSVEIVQEQESDSKIEPAKRLKSLDPIPVAVEQVVQNDDLALKKRPSSTNQAYDSTKMTRGIQRQTILSRTEIKEKQFDPLAHELLGVLPTKKDSQIPKFGPHHNALVARQTSKWLKQMYKLPVTEKPIPDLSSIKNLHPLPIYREKSIVSGVASNRHKLLRQLRAQREIQLQQEFIGHTSINPKKYIKKRLASLAHPDATASIESGSLSQSLVPTLNTSRPCHETYSILGKVGPIPSQLTTPPPIDKSESEIRRPKKIIIAHQTRRVVKRPADEMDAMKFKVLQANTLYRSPYY